MKEKKPRLLTQAIIKFLCGIVSIGALIFIPAGTLRFWNGWLLISMLFVPMFLLGIFLFLKNKDMLQKRLSNREKETSQKLVILFSLIMFIAGFIVAGLDFRFGWTQMPPYLVIAGEILLLISYGLYVETIRENAYISRTVEIQKDQKVVSTGLYGIVRHPMYTTTILLFLSFPIVLGSWISFAIFLIYPFLLVKRIHNEEEVLEKGLESYSKYKKKVKYRIIPFFW